MIETAKRPKENASAHVGYECHEKTVSNSMAPLVADSYPCFGWELENTTRPLAGVSKQTLTFKRSRHLVNKAELTRLQRKFDADLSDIETMETSKILTASIVAYAIGIIGCAFMAGAVFAWLGGLPALCVILAIPGVAGWAVPYWCYRGISRQKAADVQPYIEQKYEDIYTVCEKAHSLLA